MEVDPAKVAHETVDGEVIIIQLEKGNYYSLRDSGREAWELLSAGMSPAGAAAALGERHEAEDGEIEGFVDELATELLAESLLEESTQRTGREAPPAAAIEPSGTPFAPSKLEKYTDMQDYLLIDPIHDVTEAGWPTLPRDG